MPIVPKFRVNDGPSCPWVRAETERMNKFRWVVVEVDVGLDGGEVHCRGLPE